MTTPLLADPVWLKALDLARGQEASASRIERVARQASPEAASWAFLQWELRRRAKAKFEKAEEMFFTRDGLEMATHERVAGLHASLFHSGAPFLDATAGIGADSIALSAAGALSSVDLDPSHLACTGHNLAVHGRASRLVEGSCMDLDWTGLNVFADPARRKAGARTLQPDSFMPPLDGVLVKAEGAEHAWIKLSPLVPDPILESAGRGLLFVSHKGECCEALVESGRLAGSRRRRAVLVESSLELEACPEPSLALEPGQAVYEVDPAAVRAHCSGSFGMEALAHGWLTGPEGAASPWLTSFRVLWSGAWREKAALEGLAGRSLAAVKTRQASGLDPAAILKALRKKLGPASLGQAELMVWSSGARLRAAVVERLSA